MVHPINKIVVLHRVPKSTLYDRISHRDRHGTSLLLDLFPEAWKYWVANNQVTAWMIM